MRVAFSFTSCQTLSLWYVLSNTILYIYIYHIYLIMYTYILYIIHVYNGGETCIQYYIPWWYIYIYNTILYDMMIYTYTYAFTYTYTHTHIQIHSTHANNHTYIDMWKVCTEFCIFAYSQFYCSELYIWWHMEHLFLLGMSWYPPTSVVTGERRDQGPICRGDGAWRVLSIGKNSRNWLELCVYNCVYIYIVIYIHIFIWI